MHIARSLRASRWVLVAALSTLGACSSTPDAPTADNPFDPAGPAPGSGYGLTATVEGDSVVLRWPDREVDSWIVRHSPFTDQFAAMDDISVTALVNRIGGFASIAHKGVALESVNYYAVRGQGMVPGVAIALDVPAYVAPLGGRRNVPARAVTIEARTGVADRIELSAASDFSGSTDFDVTPGVLTELPWTLPTTGASGDTLRVFARARTASTTGPTRQLRFTANFNPSLQQVSGQRLTGQNLVAVDTVVVLQPSGEGIVDLRLRRTVDDVEEIVEIDDPLAPLLIAVPASSTEPVRWTAEFDGDFGYSVNRNITLTPALDIGNATLGVLGGASTTTEREIRLLATASGAGQVIVSEDPAFADATWVAFADTLDFTISDGFGEKTIFAAFRNPFVTERPTASASITYIVPPAIPAHASTVDGPKAERRFR